MDTKPKERKEDSNPELDPKPSYFVIIPGNIMYDKRLPTKAKLLYGIITSLCRREGFCWATNEYLAKPFEAHKTTVSKWIAALEKYKHIKTMIDKLGNRKIILSIAEGGIGRGTKGGIGEMTNTPWRNDQGIYTSNIKDNSNIPPTDVGGISKHPKDNISTKKLFDVNSLEYRLTQILLDLILERRPTYFPKIVGNKVVYQKQIQDWCVDMDHLLRIDKRDPELVLDVIEWCQKESFWQKNIISTSKLRKQFSKLCDAMEVEKGNGKTSTRSPTYEKSNNPKLTEELVKSYRRFIRSPRFKPDDTDMGKFNKATNLMIQFYEVRKHPIPKIIEPKNPLSSRVMWSEVKWIDYLFKCVDKNLKKRGDTLFPGHLCNEKFWTVQMPQYLDEIGIL